MCCVIPPASVSTTAVSRIASRRVVLPWSTWPMMVTTGGRSSRSSSWSSKLSVGRELGHDQLDLVVAERLRDRHLLPEAHHEEHDLRRLDAERLGQVAD